MNDRDAPASTKFEDKFFVLLLKKTSFIVPVVASMHCKSVVGVDSRDERKHTGRNDLLFVEKMMWMDERV